MRTGKTDKKTRDKSVKKTRSGAKEKAKTVLLPTVTVGTIMFYIALCALIAAGVIATLSLQPRLEKWLADYEQQHKMYEPKNQKQLIFDEYFADPDIDRIIELSENKPVYNAPDTYEDAVERFASKIKGKKMTFGYLAGADQKVLTVKADGVTVGLLYIKEKDEKTKYGQPVYEFDKLNMFFEQPLVTVNVRLPEKYTAYADGVEIAEQFVTTSGIKDDERDEVPEGAFLFTYKVCTLTGLFEKPEITVKDMSGNDVALLYDEEKNLYSCRYEYSEELSGQFSTFVKNATKWYSIYMQNDGAFGDVKGYIDPDTELYEDIRLNPGLFVIEHDKARVENEEVSEFFDYGDGVFSCRVTLDHILIKRGREDYVDHVDITWYLHKVGDDYKIYYMQSHGDKF